MQTTIINFFVDINQKTIATLIKVISQQLNAGNKEFQIIINSNGGSFNDAILGYNFLNGLEDVRISTHNLSSVASNALLIYLAGNERTASEGSSLVFNYPKLKLSGDIVTYDNMLQIKSDTELAQNRINKIISDKLDKTEDSVAKWFNISLQMDVATGIENSIIDSTKSIVYPDKARIVNIVY